MYLLIMEDGSLLKTETITDSEIQACDDGYISIVNTDKMTEYHHDEWHSIEIWVDPTNPIN